MNAYEILTANYTVFFLVYIRIAGMVIFNPIFNRKNIPSYLRAGFMLIITWVIVSRMGLLTTDPWAQTGTVEYLFMLIKELIIGLIVGYIMLLFIQMLQFSAEMIDTQMGFGMSKVFDPATNVQMPLSGVFINSLFMLYFFHVDGHLAIIQIFSGSFDYIPLGVPNLNLEMANFIIPLFASVVIMSLKLAMPFIAAEIMVEMCMGILMKAIPQINVFILNMPIKMFVGMFLLFLFATPISNFCDNYIVILFENLIKAMELISIPLA